MKKITTLNKYILRILKNFKFLPVKTLLKIRHKYYCNEKLNLDHPESFNAKIQWMKLYYHVPILTKLVDKYEVRDYVKETIGEKYLNELYDVFNDVEKFNFDKYPNQFVIKGVHGSSLNIIVTDKSKLDIAATKKTMQKWLKHCQYEKVGYEWAYKNVVPKIIIEKYLEEPGRVVLLDYKFFCFNGKVKFVQIDLERGIQNFRCYYDLNWKKLPFSTVKNVFYDGEVEKPINFEEMINLADQLAADLPFVRVDFYAIEGKSIFGEMTFYPTDGKKNYVPLKYNNIIGEYIALPKIPEGKKVITELEC